MHVAIKTVVIPITAVVHELRMHFINVDEDESSTGVALVGAIVGFTVGERVQPVQVGCKDAVGDSVGFGDGGSVGSGGGAVPNPETSKLKIPASKSTTLKFDIVIPVSSNTPIAYESVLGNIVLPLDGPKE